MHQRIMLVSDMSFGKYGTRFEPRRNGVASRKLLGMLKHSFIRSPLSSGVKQ